MTAMPKAARPDNSQAHRALPRDSVHLRLDFRGSPSATPPSFGDDSANPHETAQLNLRYIVGRELRVRKAHGHYINQHPERVAAHRAVAEALDAGKLAKPIFCPRCFRLKPLDAHHDDYRKPLKVRWLCRACHTHVHPKTQKNAPKKTWRWEMQATADDMAAAMARARA